MMATLCIALARWPMAKRQRKRATSLPEIAKLARLSTQGPRGATSPRGAFFIFYKELLIAEKLFFCYHLIDFIAPPFFRAGRGSETGKRGNSSLTPLLPSLARRATFFARNGFALFLEYPTKRNFID